MASNSGANLRVRISADLADIKQGLGLLRGELAKVKADAAKAAPDTGAWTAGISKIRQELGNLAGAYVGIQTITGGIRSLFDALDRADRIGELAAQAGVSTEELSKLAYGAQFSGVQIESLTDSMVKLNRGLFTNEPTLKKIGITTRDAAGNFRSASDLVKDLADVFALIPDGAEKGELAVKLFGKAGADIIPFLNEGSGAMEEYGVEAEKTGRMINGAAAAAAGEFNDNLDRLKGTLAGLANETVRNLVPAISQYAQTAVAAGEGANVAAEGGKFLATALKVVSFGAIVLKNHVEAVVNVFGLLGTVVTEVGSAIAGGFTRSVGVFVNAAKGLLTGKNPIEVFGTAIKDAMDVATKNRAAWSSAWSGIQGGFMAAKDGIAESVKDIASAGKLFSDAEVAATKATDGIKKGSEQLSPAAQKMLELIREALDTGKGSKTKDKIDQLTASTELLQDAAKRALDSLDKQFEDQKIGIADYYGKRVALQQQLIDLQIEQLQGELAVSKELDKRRRLEEQIIILQRDRQGIAVDAAREQEKAEKELNKTKLEGYRNQLSGLTGGLSAVEGSISAQMQAGSLGYVEGERRLQEVRKQTLEQLQALRAEQAAYVASLAPGDPNMAAAQEGLLGIDTAIANVTTSMQQMRQDTMDVGVSALGSFFSNLRDGAMSAAEAFRSLVGDFAKGIYDMLAQATAKRLVSAVANLFGGGKTEAQDPAQGAAELSSAATATTIAGGVIAFGASQLSKSAKELTAAATALMVANSLGSFGAAHGGGRAGGLRLTRNDINPMVFGAAPRYHGGGIAGLQGDEIPAILQRGEIIRTRQQEAALQSRMSSGQPGEVPTRIIIVFSEDELADALSGAAGEKMVVSHVRRNGGGTGV